MNKFEFKNLVKNLKDSLKEKTFFKDHIADILITFIKKPYIFLKILRNRYFSRNFKSKFILYLLI